MSRLIQQLPLFSILLLLGCAATGPPSGGPADKNGPELISIIPESVLNLGPDQKITFTFDELIEPVLFFMIPPLQLTMPVFSVNCNHFFSCFSHGIEYRFIAFIVIFPQITSINST